MSDDSRVPQAALSPEEWADKTAYRGDRKTLLVGVHTDGSVVLQRYGQTVILNDSDEFRTVAALCLYGTPEGFTHEDVSTLEWQADALERRIAAGGPTEAAFEKTYRPHILALRSISLRIKALLPPAPSHSEP